MEQISSSNQWSIEDKKCEKHYIENVRRNNSGRYSVALPFKENLVDLGESKYNSMRQFKYLENKLQSNSNLSF